jgi:predicted Zn-dependent protease with MMP-like domain
VIAARVRYLVVLVEDEPPEDQPADLLGLYDGVALTRRDSWGAPDDP